MFIFIIQRYPSKLQKSLYIYVYYKWYSTLKNNSYKTYLTTFSLKVCFLKKTNIVHNFTFVIYSSNITTKHHSDFIKLPTLYLYRLKYDFLYPIFEFQNWRNSVYPLRIIASPVHHTNIASFYLFNTVNSI